MVSKDCLPRSTCVRAAIVSQPQREICFGNAGSYRVSAEATPLAQRCEASRRCAALPVPCGANARGGARTGMGRAGAHVVPEKEIVALRRKEPVLKQPQQVVVLPVDIACQAAAHAQAKGVHQREGLCTGRGGA
jgi:hypothetical protein